jgi:hypothetical protein
VHGALFKFGGKKPFLRRGEKLTIKVLAQDREAARTVMRYIEGLLEAPLLKQKVIKTTAHAFEFADDVIIEVGTADYRSVRSYTIGMAICDEACFWSSDDGTNPAEAILAALRPAMKTVPGSLMIIASSPYSRRGPVWDRYEKWFGVANPHTLVWQAATLDMNPTIDPAEIELEFMLGPANAAAEYGANFRSDVEVLLSKEVVDAATMSGRFEIPHDPSKQFFAAIDASGGSSDSFTLGISYTEDGKGVLALLREVRPKFSPEAVCKEFANIMHSYGISTCTGDKYALGWVVEGFAKFGITLEHNEMDTSAIFGSFVSMINSSRCELLENKRLYQQLLGLERKTTRLKEIISHQRNGHDDIAVVCCASLLAAAGTLSGSEMWTRFGESYQDFSLQQFGPWKIENARSFRSPF